jgi:N-acetylmuramoyl-L-alanine amidase
MRLARVALLVAALLLYRTVLCGMAAERISLREVAERYGASLHSDNEGKNVTLTGKLFSLTWSLDKSSYVLNGVRIYGQGATGQSMKGLTIPHHDWEYVLLPLIENKRVPPVRSICIDPGHGGTDSGACVQSLGLTEKMLTLDVSLRLQKLLQEKGFHVFLTRNSDQYVPLERRSAVANEGKADLFISVHFNAAESSSASGVETYILPMRGTTPTTRLSQPRPSDQTFFSNNYFDSYNLLLAYYIEGRLIQGIGASDRGIKRGRFRVLEGTRCPAVLVECGFITSNDEGPIIRHPRHRQRIAQAICDGVLSYASRAR